MHSSPGSRKANRKSPSIFLICRHLDKLLLAGTNVTWSILLATLEQPSLSIPCLDLSSNNIYDKVFCVLNPFVAAGNVSHLAIGAMRGDMLMVEGICGSLLLNPSLKECSLVLDDTPMDCKDLWKAKKSPISRASDFLGSAVCFASRTIYKELQHGRRLHQYAL